MKNVGMKRLSRWLGRSGRRVIAASGAMLAIPMASTGARAFCRPTTSNMSNCEGGTGPELYWKSGCITYNLNQAASKQISLDQASALFTRAFAMWTAPNGRCTPSITAVQAAPTSSDYIGYEPNGPNENIVVFRDGNWPDESVQLVKPTITFNPNTGEIYDMDIEINTQDATYGWIDPSMPNDDAGATPVADDSGVSLPFDLGLVVAHAAGHMLGLGHSSDSDAIMAPYTSVGINAKKIALSDDDAAGICDIYPRFGVRTSTDSSGASVEVAEGACTLSYTGAATNTSQSCGLAPVDHGCAVGYGASSSDFSFEPWLLALCAAACRRRTMRIASRSRRDD